MAIEKIFLGLTTGDKTGDGAKLAGQKINNNFDNLDGRIEALEVSAVFNEDFETGETQNFEVPNGIRIKMVNVNQVPALRAHWSQTGNIVTVLTAEVGNIITLIN